MVSPHRYISILVCVFLCACSEAQVATPSTPPAPQAETPEAELASNPERINPVEHIIEIDLSEDGKLITQPGFNPLHEVFRGDTVTWVCIGRAAGQGLRVVLQGLFDRTPLENKVQDRFSRQVSDEVEGDATFFYDIVRGEEILDWQDPTINTGKICIPDPPTRR